MRTIVTSDDQSMSIVDALADAFIRQGKEVEKLTFNLDPYKGHPGSFDLPAENSGFNANGEFQVSIKNDGQAGLLFTASEETVQTAIRKDEKEVIYDVLEIPDIVSESLDSGMTQELYDMTPIEAAREALDYVFTEITRAGDVLVLRGKISA